MGWVNSESQKVYSTITVFLAVLIFCSAIAVIVVVNKSREQFNAYYRLQLVAQQKQDEHARLLIQGSSENTMYKILNLSNSNALQMHIPKVSDRLYLP